MPLSSLYANGDSEFPFRHGPDARENAILSHLRNHSNYLAPSDFMDYLKLPGLLLRGILANLIIILPYVILAAVLTVWLAGPTIRTAVYSNTSWDAAVVVENGEGQARLTFFDSRQDRLSLSLTDLLDSWDYSAPVTISGLPTDARVTPPGATKVADGAWRLSAQQIDSFALDLPQDAVTHFDATVRMVSDSGDDSTAPRFDIWDKFGGVSYWLIGVLAVVLLAYPVIQAVGHSFGLNTWDRRNRGNVTLAFLIGVIVVLATVELQPVAVYYFTLLAVSAEVPLLDASAPLFTALAGLLVALSRRFTEEVNRLVRVAVFAALRLLGPLIYWLLYLTLGHLEKFLPSFLIG